MEDLIISNTPRRITIKKRDDFDGYGFNLHAEKGKPGQYVGKVDYDSPAENSGLREGDRILEVNGVDIGSETHKQVVERIKAIPNETTLLVLDPTPATSASRLHTNGITNKETTTNKELSAAADNNDNHSDATSDQLAADTDSTITNENGNQLNNSESKSSSKASSPSPNGSPALNINNNNEMKKSPTTRVTTTPDKLTTSTTTTTKTITNNIIGNGGSNGNGMDKHHHHDHDREWKSSRYNNGNGTVLADMNNRSLAGDNNKLSSSTTQGQLNLKMTAAEMRAKLQSRKKYDPKNESIDLKKKHDIIDKL